jgi:hypothetical protein
MSDADGEDKRECVRLSHFQESRNKKSELKRSLKLFALEKLELTRD